MGSGCITKWAGVGYVARGGSPFSTYYGGVGVSFFTFTYIIKYSCNIPFLYFLEIGPR